MTGETGGGAPQASMQERFDAAVRLAGPRPAEAFARMMALAQEGYTPAKNDFAGYCLNGIGCISNAAQAVRWYQEAWRDGDLMAGLNLAQLKMHGIGTAQDIPGAIGICCDILKTDNEYHAGAAGLLGKIVSMGEPPGDGLNRQVSIFLKHMNAERFPQAVEAISGAIDRYPTVWGLYKNRSIARSRIDDYAGAKADLDIAIALNPKDSSLFEMRAMMRFNMRDPNAMDDLQHSKQLR